MDFTVVCFVTVSLLSVSSPDISVGEETDSISDTLDELVVTATRTPKSIKDVPVITRLISSEEIKKSGAVNIRELLTAELPGLEFSYAMSQETALSMGGFGGNALLFLVDGERLAGETMDNVDYSRLNLENVKRVEVVKGAASALYGANAVGGVVNLITMDKSQPWNISLNSRFSEEGREWRAGGDMALVVDRWNSNTAFQYSKSSTVQLADAFDTKSRIHYVYGGSVMNLTEKITYSFNDDLKFICRGGYYFRTNERETYTDKYIDYSAGIRMVWKNLELSYAFDQYDKSRWVDNVITDTHDYSNRQHTLHALYNCKAGPVTLTLGGDFINDFLTSYQFADGASHSRNSMDMFLQMDYSPLKWLSLLSSVRDDFFSGSDLNAVTGRFALMFKFQPLTVRTSYSGGFRAPSLKEMYMEFDMAGISMIYGNPDLKPERSHNLSLSIERNGQLWNGAYSITASGNYNYYDSRIAVEDIDVNGPNEAGARYYNESGVRVISSDLTLRYIWPFGIGFSASGNYLHMSGHGVDSQFSPPRPVTINWKLDFDHSFSRYYKIYASLSGRYLSAPESKFDTQGAYNILKLSLQQNIWRGIELSVAVDNLLNYRPPVYYWNSPLTSGTSLIVGISLNISEIYGK